jgi:hypothetical protein
VEEIYRRSKKGILITASGRVNCNANCVLSKNSSGKIKQLIKKKSVSVEKLVNLIKIRKKN